VAEEGLSFYDHTCELCPLHEGRRHVCIPGRGDPNAEILLLGQAPGGVEDATGSPFVGPAGRILDKALELAGLEGKVYIDNTVRCWPPGDREPNHKEVKACSKYTFELLKVMPNLKVVVALGNVAMKALKAPGGITRHRGTPKPKVLGGKTLIVLPVYHPAYVLRNPPAGDLFLSDLKSVEKLLYPEDETPVRVKKQTKDMLVWTKKMSTDVVSFDLETTGLDPDKGCIRMVSFHSTGAKRVHPMVYVSNHPLFLMHLREFLVSDRAKVVHNLAFEGLWAERHLGVEINNVVGDTMLLAWRDDENLPHNLGAVAARFFPDLASYKLDSEAALESGETWGSIPESTLARRCGLDAKATAWLYAELAAKLGPEVMKIHREVDLPIALAVARMGSRGLRVNVPALLDLGKLYEQEKKKAEKAAKKVGITCDLGSTVQLADNLLTLGIDTGMWGKPHARTGKRQMSTSDEALRNLVTECPDGKKWADPILRWREAEKLLSTYVHGMTQRLVGDMLYSRFRFPGTVTWRLSSSDPNLQNLPIHTDLGKDYRKIFISRYPEGRIVSADYSQAELRVLASLSGDPVMCEAYSQGKDIHGLTARQVYGDGFDKEQRAKAKNTNFAMIYGASAPKLSEMLRISLEEAKALGEGFKKTFRRAWAFMQELQETAETTGVVTAEPFKVARHLPVVESRLERAENARQGANFPIQHLASMLTLLGLVEAEKRLAGSESSVVCCVHDELVVDTPGDGREVGRVLREAMLSAVESQPWVTVPFAVDVAIGKNWYDLEEVDG
jgi:DNA polymerase-1